MDYTERNLKICYILKCLIIKSILVWFFQFYLCVGGGVCVCVCVFPKDMWKLINGYHCPIVSIFTEKVQSNKKYILFLLYET